MRRTVQIQEAAGRNTLWVVFFLYILILSYSIFNHELWGDEIHSWNIVKASDSLSDLFANKRYEGHPPVWYILLWGISKFTHDLIFIQLLQFIIASLAVYLLLFKSPIPLIHKILLPFGYFFLFEYGVLSRNYAIGILLAFIICIILWGSMRYRLLMYYFLLFLLSNTHLLALILAGSLHLYFLLMNIEQKKKVSTIAIHVIIGMLVFIPSLYFIFPPSDSQLGADFLKNNLNVQQLAMISKSPLRVFMPVPAWWEFNFWNTQFLLELQGSSVIWKVFTLAVSLILLGTPVLVLSKNRKCLAVFVANIAVTFIIATLFPLTTARYVGFIFIGLIVAYWLYCYETPIDKKNKLLITVLLLFQVLAGVFAVVKDIYLPFSNSYRVSELIAKVPPNEKLVTDYWCMNTVSAFTDKSLYVVGLDREASFLKWNKELKVRENDPYSNSFRKLLEGRERQKIYLLSSNSPQIMAGKDKELSNSFNLKLVDRIEGAIEKWSNLYLYEVTGLR